VAECLVRSGLTRIPETVNKLLEAGVRPELRVDMGGADRTADIVAKMLGAGDSSESISPGGKACSQ